MRPETVVPLPQTSGTEIAHGSRPRRVSGALGILRFGQRRPVQVTVDAAMFSNYLGQVDGDKSVFVGRPAHRFYDDRWVHRRCHSLLEHRLWLRS